MKELLQVMLDNQRYFKTGLCGWASSLYFNNIISLKQFRLLLNYIKKNRPSVFSSVDGSEHNTGKGDFYWTIRDIEPRIKWLKTHINKN